MTIWDHACCVGYGIQARWEALGHLVRGHKLHWRYEPDLFGGCLGDIYCENCPDSSIGDDGEHCGIIFWCRSNAVWRWIAQAVCGHLGHPELRHPQRWSGTMTPDDEHVMVDVVEDWYCYRCGASIDT
jgi:hypothetical protein